MKNLLLACFFSFFPAFSVIADAQLPNKNRKDKTDLIVYFCEMFKPCYSETPNGVEFFKVFQTPDSFSSQADLYQQCLNMMRTIYNNNQNVIQSKDERNYVIIGKNKLENTKNSLLSRTGETYSAEYIIRIEVKEGRFRVSLNFDKFTIQKKDKTETYKIQDYYPLTKADYKKIDSSFDEVFFIYGGAYELLNMFEAEISKLNGNSDAVW